MLRYWSILIVVSAWLVNVANAADLSKDGAKELLWHLQNPKTTYQAHFELWKRANYARYHESGIRNVDEFARHYPITQVVVCPQPNNEKWHVVGLAKPRRSDSLENQDFNLSASEIQELFPHIDVKQYPQQSASSVLVYDSQGHELARHKHELRSFDYLGDVNNDGTVELVQHGIKDILDGHSKVYYVGYPDGYRQQTNVLQVSTVEEKPRDVLSLLYGWSADDWTYRFVKNQIHTNLELGVVSISGFEPRVVFAWNDEAAAYEVVKTIGEYNYRVVTGLYPYTELKSFRSNDEKNEQSQRMYHSPSSLKDLSDDALIAFMASGKNQYDKVRDVTPPTHVVQNHWRLPPKEAALAMAQANRSPLHREMIELAIDDRTTLPKSVSLVLENGVDFQAILRADPKGSFLIFGTSKQVEERKQDPFNPSDDIELISKALSYEQARHAMDTIGWLGRVRSVVINEFQSTRIPWHSFCNAHRSNIQSRLTFYNKDNNKLTTSVAKSQNNHVSLFWKRQYGLPEFHGLAAQILQDLVRDGQGVTKRHKQLSTTVDRLSTIPYEAREARKVSSKILAMANQEPELINLTLKQWAVRQTGDLLIKENKGYLERAYQDATGKHYNEGLGSEFDDLSNVVKSRNHTMTYLVSSADEVNKHELSKHIALSLRQLYYADNPSELIDWACSDVFNNYWAYQRLAAIDQSGHEIAQKWWQVNGPAWWRKKHDFKSEREMSLVRQQPKREQVRPLIIAGMTLEDVNDDNRKNDGQNELDIHLNSRHQSSVLNDEQIDRLLAQLKDPIDIKINKIVEQLVPVDNPHINPHQRIDQAMIDLLPRIAQEKKLDSAVDMIFNALIQRECSEYIDKLFRIHHIREEQEWQSAKWFSLLVGLAVRHQDDIDFHRVFGKKLQGTVIGPDVLLLNLWVADARSLESDLRTLATMTENCYENSSSRVSVYPILGRYHLARQILAEWSESDPFTRIKINFLLAHRAHTSQLGLDNAAVDLRLEKNLSELKTNLSADEKVKLIKFAKMLVDAQGADWLMGRIHGGLFAK